MTRKWSLVYILTAVSVLLISHWSSKAVTVFSENTALPREHCIVIDAGHGGIDGGAISCTGIPESNINLQIALKLRDIFHLLGHETQMIRTDDRSVYIQGESIRQKKISDLKERVHIVEKTDHAILISIHQNTFSDEKYCGAQVFYSANPESKTLAQALQSEFVQTINTGSKRQAKPAAGVYLMEHISCTAILIECGFLSNPVEEAKLNNPEYQKKLCCVIASTTSSFLTNT